MAYQDRIEATLRAKDAARFRGAMKSAAKEVRKVGRAGAATSKELEVLSKIEKHLEHQTAALSAMLIIARRELKEMGRESVKTAALVAASTTVIKRASTQTKFLGFTWAFWKDRLSLTRSELTTTAITIAGYLSPALIALAGSFTQAMVGGGIVGGSGLLGFLFGVVTLGLVAKKTADNLDKIKKAQDQYNVTVDQYGASSKQASRASARLYAIIQNYGGTEAQRALANLSAISKEWNKLTSPARRDLLGILSEGTGTLKNLLPGISGQTNKMAKSLRTALGNAFSDLGRGPAPDLFRSLGSIFSSSIGPGVQGFTNLIVVIGRGVKAAAPWVIKWAEAWERVTFSWRLGTSDAGKVQKFVDYVVGHFKSWWALSKQLVRTFAIIFGAWKDEGKGIVDTITTLLDKFNDWLDVKKRQGALDRFFQHYKDSIKGVISALSNPIDSFNEYLPKVIRFIDDSFAYAAPRIASRFVREFFESDSWVKFLALNYLLLKFGVFAKLGRAVAIIFLKPFVEAFIVGFEVSMGITTATGGRVATFMEKAGLTSGKWFAKGMAVGIALSAALIAQEVQRAIEKQAKNPKNTGVTGAFWDTLNAWHKIGQVPGLGPLADPFGNMAKVFKGLGLSGFGGAGGGIIPPGDQAWVGERGPEIARNTPWGTELTPLSRNSKHTLRPMEIPALNNSMHITVNTSVQVNRREIARAVADENAYVTARRGGQSAGE